jgi:hypothetical protein
VIPVVVPPVLGALVPAASETDVDPADLATALARAVPVPSVATRAQEEHLPALPALAHHEPKRLQVPSRDDENLIAAARTWDTFATTTTVGRPKARCLTTGPSSFRRSLSSRRRSQPVTPRPVQIPAVSDGR